LADNRINGFYACENNGTLATDLKITAGFEGWVMSDWGATHSMSINQGLDQEMPGGSFMGGKLKAAVQDGTVSQATLDDSVKRILTQMYKFKLFDNINQWNGSTHQADVTSLAHSQVARNVSSAATVLLKNNGVLPLKQGTKIVLIGSDAVNPTVHGGGSGSVEPMYVISPFTAIATRNTGKVPPSGAPKMPAAKCTVLDKDFDYFIQPSEQLGGTFGSASACCQGCGTIPGADGKPKWYYFTWTGSDAESCWCHQGQGEKRAAKGYVSGSCGTPPAPPSPAQCGGTLIQNADFNTPDSGQVKGTFAAPADCCEACGKDSVLWLYFTRTSGGDCWCHKSDHGKKSATGYSSGSCRKAPPPPPAPSTATVTTYTGSDPTEAAAAAAKADVAIVFVSTTSSEGSDRSSLSFADSQNAIVDAVAKAQKSSVVVMANPGAVLTPWSDDVAAALTMFMPGLEMGNALSDILYGDVNPSGRLPLTFPNKENEVNFTKSQWPGLPVSTGLESTYTEKLEVGYRWYDAHKVTPKFAFGHGLSYTRFEYSSLSVSGLSVSFYIKNGGAVVGAEVPQLYIGYPSSAGEPPQVLRGFEKIMLAPQQSQKVTFTLTSGDLSIWDPSKTGWAPVQGTFQVYVGSSSRDIMLTGSLTHTNPAETVPAWV
jgi:beta-glucosidase